MMSSTKVNENTVTEIRSSIPSRDYNISAGTDNFSGGGPD